MKTLVLTSLFLISSAGLFAQAELFFFTPEHKFPKAEEGDFLKHYFIFENTGNQPLLFTDYKVSCSCTKVRFPLKPIPPGVKDSILVTFDSENKRGFQHRKIDVYTNSKISPTPVEIKVLVGRKKD